MPAHSVTGRGRGISNGILKPNNHCGCGSCSSENESPKKSVVLNNKCNCRIIDIKNENKYFLSNSNSTIRICE